MLVPLMFPHIQNRTKNTNYVARDVFRTILTSSAFKIKDREYWNTILLHELGLAKLAAPTLGGENGDKRAKLTVYGRVKMIIGLDGSGKMGLICKKAQKNAEWISHSFSTTERRGRGSPHRLLMEEEALPAAITITQPSSGLLYYHSGPSFAGTAAACGCQSLKLASAFASQDTCSAGAFRSPPVRPFSSSPLISRPSDSGFICSRLRRLVNAKPRAR